MADSDIENRSRQGAFSKVRAVLFDLDGTLADTAPDLGAAANVLRTARGLSSYPVAKYRSVSSAGARGLLRVALDKGPEDPDFDQLREEFFSAYEQLLCVDTRLFEGMNGLLEDIETRGLLWGVVTNKSARFANPLVERLGLAKRIAVMVCGDSTPHLKPHPAPLLRAAELLAIEPSDCLYIGDDLRDIQSARAAGMASVAAAYGYCDRQEVPGWGADAIIEAPEALAHLLTGVSKTMPS